LCWGPACGAQIKNVQHAECLMSRFILVALDGYMRDKCTELQRGGLVIQCARSKTEPGGGGGGGGDGGGGEDGVSALSADGLRAHKLGRWAEASTVVSAGVNVWAFDVDVVLLEVPDLAAGPAKCCPPRHPTHCAPSFLEKGII